MSKFELNTAPITLNWGVGWIFFEVDFEDWKDEYFSKLITFRREHIHDNYSLESSGRIFILIPKSGELNTEQIRLDIERELTEVFEVNLSLNKLKIPNLQRIERDDIKKAVKSAIGGMIEDHLVDSLGFTKMSSKGDVGRFFHRIYSESKTLQRQQNVSLHRLFDFVVHVLWNDKIEAYLSIDIVTEVDGEEILQDIIKNGNQKFDVNKLPNDKKKWVIEQKNEFVKNGLDKYRDIKFSLIDVLPASTGQHKPVNLLHGALKDKNVKQFMETVNLPISLKGHIALLKDKTPNSKDPNKIYHFPAQYLKRKLTNSSAKNQEWEFEFHKFSKPTIKQRKDTIMQIFQILKKDNIIGNIIEFTGLNPKIAYPAVGNYREKSFGSSIRLNEHGVHKWGNLQKVIIYHGDSDKQLASSFKSELYSQLTIISKKSSGHTCTVDLKEIKDQTQVNPPELMDSEKTIHLFLRPNFSKGFSYKNIKQKFTQEKGLPVQFVKTNTLKRGQSNRTIVRTLIPQLIAKTGGQPYHLLPKILDNTMIIGLDKARDSSSDKPSASAGVSAVTPEGIYVTGASTPLDSTKHDKIDVSKLAPDLLREIKGKYKDKLEYVVILRDGSPETCKEEVPEWKKYVTEFGMNMVFFAVRKENPYRIFPKHIIDDGKRINYDIPVILDGKPLPNNEFMVVTSNAVQGTPQPVLYTLMENNEDFTTEEIKDKVLAQVISLSMLCWESPRPTSQPLPLHYADKLAAFTQLVQQAWRSAIQSPMFI
ncbi:MAG: Piwi domain-containing protein [Candidatus Heimdallarchaeota archaeon]|nr:Piwi domain-containing protein [Candidatus Heimdallarchaeota archaeon]